jgi:peptidoglycan/LPS O-acetylase OafA/YrhL
MLFGVRLGLLPHAFLPRLVIVLAGAVGAGTASWLLVERVMLARAARLTRRTRRLRVSSRPAPART